MKFSTIIYLSSAVLLATCSNAFTVTQVVPRATALASSVPETEETFFVDEATAADADAPQSLVVSEEQVEKPKPVKKAPKKPAGGHGKGGLFAPVVRLAKRILGERFIKVRGKVIGVHSGVIKDFVDTSDSKIGQFALEFLFDLADTDKNGQIDEAEFRDALKRLGFNHLREKQITGIFARADKDGNGTLDLEEFKAEAPNTLKTNLIKLAKSNGDELGFLA